MQYLFILAWHVSGLHFEDGTDRVFGNVGIWNSDAGELPRRKHTTFRTRWKFEIEIELFESSELTCLYFYLWGWIKNEACKRKVNTRYELLARIWNASATVKNQGQLRRTTRLIRTRIISCIEVDCKMFENFVVNCNKFVFSL